MARQARAPEWRDARVIPALDPRLPCRGHRGAPAGPRRSRGRPRPSRLDCRRHAHALRMARWPWLAMLAHPVRRRRMDCRTLVRGRDGILRPRLLPRTLRAPCRPHRRSRLGRRHRAHRLQRGAGRPRQGRAHHWLHDFAQPVVCHEAFIPPRPGGALRGLRAEHEPRVLSRQFHSPLSEVCPWRGAARGQRPARLQLRADGGSDADRRRDRRARHRHRLPL